MFEAFKRRSAALQARMAATGVDCFVITDRDSLYYFAAAENTIERSFGRPTILFIPAEGTCSLLVPFADCPMIEVMSWVRPIIPFRDSHKSSWQEPLLGLLASNKVRTIGIETFYDSLVMRAMEENFGRGALRDATSLIAELRLIKDEEEVRVLRQAGIVADAMMRACCEALREEVPEYEVSLAAIAAGTRAAARFLTDQGPGRLASPMIHGLQVMKSGPNTVLGHCRPTVRRIAAGEPVAVCLCGMVNFGNMKLALDRPFHIRHMTHEQEAMCAVALESQRKALELVRPGAVAEDIHRAAAEVIRASGYGLGSRTGRGLGHSFSESPQLIDGDRTVLRPGMVLAVDGNLKVPGYGVQFGDSVIVTEAGHELLTNFPREIKPVQS